MFDNIPVKEKKLFWIQGTTRRWDGYTYFQKEPKQMLEWFETSRLTPIFSLFSKPAAQKTAH